MLVQYVIANCNVVNLFWCI